MKNQIKYKSPKYIIISYFELQQFEKRSRLLSEITEIDLNTFFTLILFKKNLSKKDNITRT